MAFFEQQESNGMMEIQIWIVVSKQIAVIWALDRSIHYIVPKIFDFENEDL